MTRFFQSLKNEFWHVVPVFIFFFAAFILINETERFFFQKAGLKPFSFLDIGIAAALVAKIFLVLDHLPIPRFFRKKPLIYHVTYKTIFYWTVAFLIRMGIRFFHFLLLEEGLAAEWRLFYTQIDWKLVVSIQSWYMMLFFLFVTSRELSRLIGPEKMRTIFFGK